MPKPIGEFTVPVVLKFIQLVRSRPYLWDPNHGQYNNRWRSHQGWKQIEKELREYKLSSKVLRQKWKNLRDTFRRELKKCTINDPDDYNGKWMFFRPIFFLAGDIPMGGIEIMEQEQNMIEQEEDCEEMPDKMYDIKIESTSTHDAFGDITESVTGDVQHGVLSNTKIETKTPEDYDLMFLKSLVPYFTNLDPRRKLVLRNKLQYILLKELSEQDRCNDS